MAEAPIHFQVSSGQYVARTLSISIETSDEESSLATCFQLEKNKIIGASALYALQADVEKDDIFAPEFLQRIIFTGAEYHATHFASDTERVFEEWKTLKTEYVPAMNIINGPYYINRGLPYSVWKVYPDRQLSFLQATWQSQQENGTFIQSNIAGNGYRAHGIAVPARSYSSDLELTHFKSENHSNHVLRGLRFSVKDNCHLRGTSTSIGNRAYYETYPIQNTTADIVSKLIDKGAHLVGKNHLSSFAMMEHPTQSVDYHAPFNPRGDGYLITGGSSGGGAAAIAAYGWLDFAVCSDTTGSFRIPALQTGIFGFRPSTNSISSNGWVKAWPGMDTPAWFGRDLELFPSILYALLKFPSESGTLTESLTEILYATDFMPVNNPEQVQAVKDWTATAPVGEKDLRTYLYHTTGHGWFYTAYHSFDTFRKEYREINGHDPFVTEVVWWYWSLGSQVTLEQFEEITRRFLVFKTWFNERYMQNSNLITLHIDTIAPKYRDQYPDNDNPEVPGLRATIYPRSWERLLAVPISQLSYESRITGRTEQMPMVVSLLGSAGRDGELLQWTSDALRKSGRSTKVKTGKTAF